ncbi:MAG: DUF1028 domain-containing protein [Pseudomonadota bacterium]
MTFSLVARCADTGMFGVAVSSSSPAVAARCAYAEAGVGAAASLTVTDPRLGPPTLRLLADGATAAEAIAAVARTAPHPAFRQVLAVDRYGASAIHSGANALGLFREAQGENVAAAGNILADASVPQAMVDAFQSATGHLGERLLIAMQAALDAGGEEGPVRSAGLKLVRDTPWPIADLRVDWSEGCPIADLRALWAIYAPQLEDYVTRALDPTAAPSYGVPGDE